MTIIVHKPSWLIVNVIINNSPTMKMIINILTMVHNSPIKTDYDERIFQFGHSGLRSRNVMYEKPGDNL
jgi:hypothetical protein